MQETYYKHISAKHNLFDLKLGEVWKARELAWLFTKREFKVAYKQTILGPLWIFIRPLLTSIVHVIVFVDIARLSTGGVPPFLFQLTSTAIWAYFSGILNSCAGTFLGNARLFGKVYFPRLIMPISTILSSVIRYAIQMTMVVALLCYFIPSGNVTPNYHLLILVPIILIWLGFLGMGIGIIISSLTTKYRDLSVLVGFGMQLWMYASPVVYPLTQFPATGWLRTVLIYNPVTAPIELLRYIILGSGTVLGGPMVISIAVSILVVLVGIMLFNRIERTFLDTV